MFDTRGVPKKVLLGKVPKFAKVGHLYRANLLREFFKLLNESFWRRAKDKSDPEIGITWKRLADRTIKEKGKYSPHSVSYDPSFNLPDYSDYNTPEIGKKVSKLNPREQAKFNATFRALLAQDPSHKSSEKKERDRARAKAKADAWDVVNPKRAFISLINIRTGRLVAATAPGTVVGGRYYAGPDQRFTISNRKIAFDLDKVEYAREVDIQRTIIPEDISVWLIKAHDIAIIEASQLYVTIKQSIDYDRERSKKSSRIKSPARNKKRRNNNSSRG